MDESSVVATKKPREDCVIFDLSPELSNDTPVEMVRFPMRIRKAVAYAGWKTIGDVRNATEEKLTGIPNLGSDSIQWLHKSLGGRCSTDRRHAGVTRETSAVSHV